MDVARQAPVDPCDLNYYHNGYLFKVGGQGVKEALTCCRAEDAMPICLDLPTSALVIRRTNQWKRVPDLTVKAIETSEASSHLR